MPTLIENLNLIESCKSDIKSAIEAKGVDMTGVSFPGYADAIGSITTQFVTESLSVSINGTYTPGQGVDGYSQVVVNVPQSVNGITEKEYTERNVSIANINNSASYVASNVFTNNSYIQTVYLPSCTVVNMSAFQSCTNLTTVSLPVCRYIDKLAFGSCRNLSSIYLPSCVSLYSAAFCDCANLTSVDLPSCTYIESGVFYRCNNLSYVSLPVCTYIAGTTYGVVMGAFQETALTSIDLPVCSYIGSSAFIWVSTLSTITLGYSSVCNLANSMALNGTPIYSGTGSIYVPSSLVDSYKSANPWSYFSSIIFPIPE